MAYVTPEQLEDYLENAGGAGARTAASLAPDRLRANVEEASAEVVGRLSGFTLPDPGLDPTVSPATTPPLLRTIILGIAGYLATLEFFGSQPVEERDPVVLRYARARELLGQLTSGALVVVGITPAAGEGTAPTGTASVFNPASVGLADGWLDDMRGSPTAPPYAGGQVWS